MYLLEKLQKTVVTDPADPGQSVDLVGRGREDSTIALSTNPLKPKIFDDNLGLAATLGTAVASVSVVAIGATTGAKMELSEFMALSLTGLSAPALLIGWRVRGAISGWGKSLAGKLKPRASSSTTPKALEISSTASLTTYKRSTPRYRSQGNHWKNSAYGDSYRQGYMDSIYCDYEDNHLEKSSNYNHY